MSEKYFEISIVMAVRNTPEYALKESLESIFSQEFYDFELICVDDGSTNVLTKMILSEYEKKDSRMRVIWLENQVGAGAAKNIGLCDVRGKYTISLDSDDYFPPHYLKELYECMEHDCADVCITGFRVFQEDGCGKKITSVHKLNRSYSSYLEAGDLLIQGTLSACNKLVRTDYLKSEGISFITTKTEDDVLYGAMVLLCTSKISVLKDSEGFFYRFNTNYQLSSHMNPLNLLTGIFHVKNKLKERNKDNAFTECLLATYLIHTGIMEMFYCKEDRLNQKFYDQTADYLKNGNLDIRMEQTIIYRNKWISLPYESKWFELIGNYEKQLDDSKDKLIKKLSILQKPLIVWGMGKRGKAFESFAKKNKIEIYAVCDQANNQCGIYDEYNNLVIRDEEALGMKRVSIIATNNKINEFLKKNYGIDAISIEEYCEL